MNSSLESVKRKAYLWLKSELDKAPFWEVRKPNSQLEYFSDKMVQKIPASAGIYFIYPITGISDPIYVGEGGNLRRRLAYHFSESQSAKKNSTLKKKLLSKGFPTTDPTSKLVKLKYLTIPFGRKELELMLHEEYGINTKEKTVK